MLPGQKMLSPGSHTPPLPRHIHSVLLELLIDTSALRTQGSGGGLWGAQQGGAQKAPSTASVTLSLNINTALSCLEVKAMQTLSPCRAAGHSSRCCSHPVRKEDGKRGEAESAGISGSPTLRHLTRATPVQAEGLLSAQQIKHRHFGNRHLHLKPTVSAGKQPLPISLPLRFCFRSHRSQPLPQLLMFTLSSAGCKGISTMQEVGVMPGGWLPPQGNPCATPQPHTVLQEDDKGCTQVRSVPLC